MKKTKKLLSLLTALAITASSFAAMVIPASAQDTEYFSDDFESYTTTGLEGQGTSDQTGTLGNLNTAVGSRSSGGDGASNLVIGTTKLGDNETKYLTFVSGGTATSSRGASISFNSSCGIPAYSALTGVLDIDFDMYFTNDSSTLQFFGITSDQAPEGGAVFNDPYLSRANNKNIPLNAWVNVNMQIASDKKVNLSITDKDGKLLDAKSFTASGDAVGKIATYGGNSSVSIDNLVVKQTDASNYGEATVTIKTDGDANLEGATVKLDSFTLPLTAADGTTKAVVPAGTYTVTAHKDGYEMIAEQENDFSGSITVAASTGGTVTGTLLKQVYTPTPETVTVKGGQAFVAAAATGSDPTTSTAFTVDVIDQKGVAVADGYATEWKIYPTGTTTENAAVTIDDGVVSVASTYKAAAANGIDVYDVVANVTLNDSSKEAKTTIKIGNSEILSFDETKYAPTGRSTTFDLPSTITVPENGQLLISFDFIPGTLGGDGAANATAGFRNGDTVQFGLQRNADGIYVFTTNSIGKDANADGHKNAFTNSALVTKTVDNAKTYHVELSIIGEKLVANFDGAYYTIPFPNAASLSVNKLVIGNYRQSNAFGMTVSNLLTSSKINVDQNAMDVEGDTNVARVKGQSVTRQYTPSPLVEEDDETFTWTMDPATYAGVTLSDAGVLTITDTAAPGTVKVIATSSVRDGAKQGETEVTISDFQKLTLSADGPEAYQFEANGTGNYVLTSALDGCGDDMVALDTLPELKWSSSDTEVATIDEDTGELTLVSKGTTTVKATVTNDTQVSEIEIPVVVDNYYITGDVASDAETTDVDMTDIVVANKYLVTTAKDGKVVEQKEVAAPKGILPPTTKTVASEAGVKLTATYANGKLTSLAAPVNVAAEEDIDLTPADANTKVFFWKSLASAQPAKTETKTEEATGPTSLTIDTTGATKYEIAPIFEAADINVVNGYKMVIPDGAYDFSFTKKTGDRVDLLVNDHLVGQNVDQGGTGRGSSGGTVYDVDNIIVAKGYAVVRADDINGVNAAGDLSKLAAHKTPEIVDRKTHIYIAGDSTVCIYYGGNEQSDVKDLQTGWGQVFDTYLDTDQATVVDLANSGIYAKTWYDGAFSTIQDMAQDGDYLIIQFGINDRSYSTKEVMTDTFNKMIDACREIGVTPVLVTPQKCTGYAWYTADASKGDTENWSDAGISWSDYAGFTQTVRDVATAKNVLLVDSANLSAEAFFNLGKDYVVANFHLSNENDNDGKCMHFSYAGAQKLASMIAQSIYDQQQASVTAGANDAGNENFDGIPVITTGAGFTFTDSKGESQTYNVVAGD